MRRAFENVQAFWDWQIKRYNAIKKIPTLQKNACGAIRAARSSLALLRKASGTSSLKKLLLKTFKKACNFA